MRPTRLFVLLPLVFLALLPAHAGHKPQPIYLRVHVQTPGQGLSPQQAQTITLPEDGEQIQIRSLPEVSERNLIDVKTDAAGHVRLFFDHEGTVALSAVTAQNQGRILVVLINGTVVYSPTIDIQITSGELDIPHTLPAAILKLLDDSAKANMKFESGA